MQDGWGEESKLKEESRGYFKRVIEQSGRKEEDNEVKRGEERDCIALLPWLRGLLRFLMRPM